MSRTERGARRALDLPALAMQVLEEQLVLPADLEERIINRISEDLPELAMHADLEERIINRVSEDLPELAMQALKEQLVLPAHLEERILTQVKDGFVGQAFDHRHLAKPLHEEGRIESLVRKATGRDSHVPVRYTKCCNPVPGDEIIGIITRGRGIKVHRPNCPTAFDTDPERRVKISWDDWAKINGPVQKINGPVQITVMANRAGILTTVRHTFRQQRMNVCDATCRISEDGQANFTFTVLCSDLAQLNNVIRQLQRTPGVMAVEERGSSELAQLKNVIRQLQRTPSVMAVEERERASPGASAVVDEWGHTKREQSIKVASERNKNLEMSTTKTPKTGDELDAYCPTCRVDHLHRFIAMVDDVLKEVECKTCGSHHLYRRPKTERDAAEARMEGDAAEARMLKRR